MGHKHRKNKNHRQCRRVECRDFNWLINAYPDVHRTAAELDQRFVGQRYFGPLTRDVRTIDQLVPAFSPYRVQRPFRGYDDYDNRDSYQSYKYGY